VLSRDAYRQSRADNDAAELRAQVRRLQEMIETQIDSERLNPAGTDIVGALTRVCLTDQPTTGHFDAQPNRELVQRVQDLVWFDLLKDGFTSTAPPGEPLLAEDAASLDDIIRRLPSLETFRALSLRFRSTWLNAQDHLFTPIWYIDTLRLYEDAFTPAPSASRIAELYAFFCAASQVDPLDSDEGASYDHEVKAWTAFELADRSSTFDLHYVRALSLIAKCARPLRYRYPYVDTSVSVKLFAEKTTDHIGQGLGLIDRALGLAAEFEMVRAAPCW
jgi:hypothetical protein